MQKRIAGYDQLYSEVVIELRDTVDSYCARWIYFVLVSLFYVEEEWGDDPVWVYGIVNASKKDIAKKSGVSYKAFFRPWQKLTEAGRVKEQDDGTLLLPHYRKKGLDAISAREIRENRKQFNERISRLEELHPEDLDAPEDRASADSTDHEPRDPHIEGKSPQYEGNNPQYEGRPSLLDAFKQTSLSGNTIVSYFYRGIRQTRISHEKREKALKVFRKLRKDGFSLEDIAFAVIWTLENAREEPYDFAIITHTVSQAIGAREKEESERRAIEEREKAVEEERATREAEQSQREEIEKLKAGLGKKEREELREKARAELLETGVKADMIDDFVIGMKENEILRR